MLFYSEVKGVITRKLAKKLKDNTLLLEVKGVIVGYANSGVKDITLLRVNFIVRPVLFTEEKGATNSIAFNFINFLDFFNFYVNFLNFSLLNHSHSALVC